MKRPNHRTLSRVAAVGGCSVVVSMVAAAFTGGGAAALDGLPVQTTLPAGVSTTLPAVPTSVPIGGSDPTTTTPPPSTTTSTVPPTGDTQSSGGTTPTTAANGGSQPPASSPTPSSSDGLTTSPASTTGATGLVLPPGAGTLATSTPTGVASAVTPAAAGPAAALPAGPAPGFAPVRTDANGPELVGPPALGDLGPAGPRSTTEIIRLLASINAPSSTLAKVLAPFPVAGPASYSDDWHAPRTAGGFHLHEGCDIFAPLGTPAIASTDGKIANMATDPNGGLGGTSLDLTGPDGTVYYYAHLDHFAAGVSVGTSVTKGQVLGFVGNTGDAAGGPTHLHFEIHPGGGDAVPPVPYLDRWLADATVAARRLAGTTADLHNGLSFVPTPLRGSAIAATQFAKQIVARSERVSKAATGDPSMLIIGGGAGASFWLIGRRRRRRVRTV